MIIKNLFSGSGAINFVFIGLGNPGREYEFTRHNMGFLVIDRIAEKWNVDIRRLKYKSLFGEFKTKDFKTLLVKPQTYMNLSGQAVKSFTNFYKLPLENLMVIFDDLDLPFGEIRIRESGGSSGQKGMRSIIENLATQDFPRMRVGIGRPRGRRDPADFILDTFTKVESLSLDLVLDSCADAVEVFIRYGIEKAMTLHNHSAIEND